MKDKFQVSPKIYKKVYDFIRNLSDWTGGDINIYTPFIILVDKSGDTLKATDVIGKASVSCKFVLHPENLGGRAAGVKATCSSTNGAEKRGGHYKTKTKGIIEKLPKSEKNNFIYVIEGGCMLLSDCASIDYVRLTEAQLRSYRR